MFFQNLPIGLSFQLGHTIYLGQQSLRAPFQRFTYNYRGKPLVVKSVGASSLLLQESEGKIKSKLYLDNIIMLLG